jgi:hypothetical protein
MSTLSAEGYRMINGHQALYHSQYKGWDLYRCYDGGSARMLYFAVAVTDTGGLTVLEARNLAGIKKRVTEEIE